MRRKTVLPLIGVTMGDPTGIGPEVVVKALCMRAPFLSSRPVVFGDPLVLSRTLQTLGLDGKVEGVRAIPEEGYTPGKIFVVPVSHLGISSLRPGRPDRACGEAMVKYVEEAVFRVRNRQLDAITTCPINKHAINRSGYAFSGHTELLAHLAGTPSAVMMFAGRSWKVVLVTTHLSIRDVPRWIRKDRILTTVRVTDEGMRRAFKTSRPRIAVLGLNPHAGEEGLLGQEEAREIVPAVETARAEGIDVEGPFPADSFFGPSHQKAFDVVVAMYHDQGLIPIKMSGFDKAVNVTLGLPFIRTSVGHGTAYDIAGRGLASPKNLVRAIRVASNLFKLKEKHPTTRDGKSC